MNSRSLGVEHDGSGRGEMVLVMGDWKGIAFDMFAAWDGGVVQYGKGLLQLF